MRTQFRLITDKVFTLLIYMCGFVVMTVLLIGITLVFHKGAMSLSVPFILNRMAEGGISGGVFYQILGTLILLVSTLLIVTPLAFSAAIVQSVYIKNPSLRKLFALFLYTLNGIPSIIYGIVGFFFFVKLLGLGKSWLTGSILLAMMILPTTALALHEGIKRVPSEYVENARSLGMSTTSIIYSVLLPQSIASFLSGILLGLARAIGETAPIMFTATVFSGAMIPHGIKDNPVLTLPYHIFTLTQESYHSQAVENAWASACVLIVIVFLLSACALPFRLYAHEEARVR